MYFVNAMYYRYYSVCLSSVAEEGESGATPGSIPVSFMSREMRLLLWLYNDPVTRSISYDIVTINT